MTTAQGSRRPPRTVKPRKAPIDDVTADKIVELYQANRPTAEIQRITGVPRGSVYYILQKRGIEPNRLGVATSDGRVSNNTLLDRLTAAEQLVGELRADRDRLQATLDTLLDRLGITPAAAVRALGTSNRQATKGKP